MLVEEKKYVSTAFTVVNTKYGINIFPHQRLYVQLKMYGFSHIYILFIVGNEFLNIFLELYEWRIHLDL